MKQCAFRKAASVAIGNNWSGTENQRRSHGLTNRNAAGTFSEQQ
jgi:hypothetical protein